MRVLANGTSDDPEGSCTSQESNNTKITMLNKPKYSINIKRTHTVKFKLRIDSLLQFGRRVQ